MKKLMIVSLVAAAGLTVAACKKEAPAVAGGASNVVDTTAALNGTTNDVGVTNTVAGVTNTVAGVTNTVAPVAATNATAN